MQKPITVSCDTSTKGVGTELLKDDCPAAYTTRSLTEAESRYVHIEKKLLAVCSNWSDSTNARTERKYRWNPIKSS